MKINRNSWHYRYISMFTSHDYQINNVCAYVSRGFLGTVILAFFLYVFGVFGYIILCPALSLLGVAVPPSALMLGILLYIMTIAGLTLYLFVASLIELCDRYSKKAKSETQTDSVAKEWYRSKKGRYCTRIEFEG